MALRLGTGLSKTKTHRYISRKSIHFDATDSFMEVIDSSTFDHDDTSESIFTISLWFKSDDGDGTLADVFTLFSKFASSKHELILYLHTDSKLKLSVTADGSTALVNDLGFTLGDTNWHHVLVSYKGSITNEVVCYVDGSLKTVTQNGSNPTRIYASTGNVFIGSKDGSNDFFDGYIDDVFWCAGEAFNAAEAAHLYNEGSPRNLVNFKHANGKRAYWRMGDGAGVHPVGGGNANFAVIPNMIQGHSIRDGGNLFDDNAANTLATVPGTYSWTKYTNNTVTNVSMEKPDGTTGGTVRCTWVDDAKGMFLLLKDATALTENLTVGALYEFSCDLYLPEGDAIVMILIPSDDSLSQGTSTAFLDKNGVTSNLVGPTGGGWLFVKGYFYASHATDDKFSFLLFGSGEYCSITNQRLVAVQGDVAAYYNGVTTDIASEAP